MNNFVNKHSSLKDILRQIPLFTSLKEDTLEVITHNSNLVEYRKGQFIFFQSDTSDKCFIVQSGQVSILLDSADGREMVINEMQPGDIFGELGVLTNKTRSTSAVARTDTKLLVLSKQVFENMLDKDPLLARRLLEMTANRLRNSSERESALAFLDAQARLARLLLQLDKNEIKKGYVTISQEELAQRTSLTRQTVAKALSHWRKEGWLITGRGRILLLQRKEFLHLEKQWAEK